MSIREKVLGLLGYYVSKERWVEDHYEPDGCWYNPDGSLYTGGYVYGVPLLNIASLLKYLYKRIKEVKDDTV